MHDDDEQLQASRQAMAGAPAASALAAAAALALRRACRAAAAVAQRAVARADGAAMAIADIREVTGVVTLTPPLLSCLGSNHVTFIACMPTRQPSLAPSGGSPGRSRISCTPAPRPGPLPPLPRPLAHLTLAHRTVAPPRRPPRPPPGSPRLAPGHRMARRDGRNRGRCPWRHIHLVPPRARQLGWHGLRAQPR